MADHKTDGLSVAQRNFLSRRIAAGDKLTQARAQHYIDGHHRAVAAGLEVDSPRYFRTVGRHADALGGKQPPKPTAAAQPSKIRYDGSSHPMPKLKGGGDEFHKLRNAASNGGRYGKKT
jgi:hypothetical protein